MIKMVWKCEKVIDREIDQRKLDSKHFRHDIRYNDGLTKSMHRDGWSSRLRVPDPT